MKLRASLLFVLFLASPVNAVMRYIDGEPLPTEDRSALNENFKKVDREFRNTLRSNADARPAADSIFNLGASGTEWANLYVDNIIISTQSYVLADSGNGHGGTNTKIRRFTNSTTVGTCISYADSAANGGSFTIATGCSGVYAMHYQDRKGATTIQIGISRNSTTNTTNIADMTFAQGKLTNANVSDFAGCDITTYLSAGDVIRAHGNGAADDTGTNSFFRIERIR